MMRRSSSLPQVVSPSTKEEKLKFIGHINFRGRTKVSISRIKYKGRHSLNKTVRGKTEYLPSYGRNRQLSGNASSAQSFPYHLDENSLPYNSIPSKPVLANTLVLNLAPVAVSSGMEDSDLSSEMSDRTCFYKKLQHLSTASASGPTQSILTGSTRTNNDRGYEKEVYLMTLKDEKHKKGDLLWLAFQALLAGRNMQTWRDQLRSLRDQDAYIMERRRQEASILDEIRNFHFNDANFCVSPKDPQNDGMQLKLQKVRDLLERLEKFECLFPSIIYMMKVQNFDKKLRDRIAVLNMWYETTKNLYQTIRDVGGILGVSDNRRSSNASTFGISDSESLTAAPLSWPSLEGSISEELSGVRRKLGATSELDISFLSFSTSSDLPALLNQTPHQYTEFVSKSLKLKGMRRVLERLENVCAVAISKAVILLQKPPGSYAEAARIGNTESKQYLPITAECFTSRVLEGLQKFKLREKQEEKYSVHHEEFIAMGLPSFVNLFYYLVRIPLDLVDEWLKMRRNMQLNTDLLTLQAVMEDCHDCLRAAISVKHTYVALVQMVGLENQKLLENLAEFENHLSDVFKNYLTCVRHWALAELSTSSCADWGDRFFNELVKEWKLAKRFSVNVICGEEEVAHRFCIIGKDLLQKMVKNYFSDATDVLEERRSDFTVSNGRRISSQIHETCRHFRELVKELRSRASRALPFACCMVYDLEKCALYRIKSEIQELLYQLYARSYVLVVLPHELDSYILFCDENAGGESVDFVRVLLNITGARYEGDLPPHVAKRSGYLLIFARASFGEFSSYTWRGRRIHVDVDPDTDMFLKFLHFHSDVCLVALNGNHLKIARRQFEAAMKMGGDCLLDIVEEHFCCHDGIAAVISQLKEEAADAYREIWKGLVEEMIDEILDERSLRSLDSKELNTLRDTLLQAYWLTFEYRREMYDMLPRSMRRKFAEDSVDWIRHWLSFVTKFRGDLAKHWTARSWKFLIFAAHPQLTSLLSKEQYKILVSSIKLCIEHTTSIHSQDCSSIQENTDERTDPLLGLMRRAASLGDVHFLLEVPGRLEKIRAAVKEVDEKRDEVLRKQGRVGNVKHIVRKDLSLKSLCGVKKRAPFDWRRTDNKIGKGRFGTVYIVITQFGVMAMKQINIDSSRKAVSALIDEVENLRKLDHENIVKYHGIEVHPEEVLIFMEYCPGGSLESKCTGSIEMPLVRWYTCCLLKAVEYIHKRLIIHRDIKPANIFIGRGNVLKLGDFGTSVHLRATTTAFGEVVEWVGTPAYMAPEVQTLGRKVEECNNEEKAGYGRAADIWSVGCVVLEMCTGKPPWHGLNMFQIIFQVGSGMRPSIPPKLMADEHCVSFLDCCFQINPDHRKTAPELRQHPFANVTEDAKEIN